jgi:HPt (histidine-containing phosphotransfer) domain-containing protein
VKLFLTVVPTMIADIEGAVAEGDAYKVRQLAHKLRGSCLSLGTPRLAQACLAIESAARAGLIDEARCRRLRALYASVQSLLEAALNGADSGPLR